MSDAQSLEYGFSSSIPQTDGDIEEALQSALLSLDANVLLSFYRYSPNARDALLSVLRAAGDRVWVSHQAAREFWRNRANAIDSRSQATEQLYSAIDRSETSALSAIEVWAKRTAVPEDSKQRAVEAISGGFTLARESIESEIEAEKTVAYDTRRDSILAELLQLLHAHVGPALCEDERAEALEEGRLRAAAKVPPGYMDADKEEEGGPDGPSGDYLVWRQSVLEAQRRGCSLAVVTGDEKEDWWWKHRNVFMGPRPELVSEFSVGSRQKLFMLRPVQLINHAAVLNVVVSDTAAIDIERASSDETRGRWTRTAVQELLRRLDDEGREQSDVIRFAATQGGVVKREGVYAIAGYDEDRKLVGFTRPTARITRHLIDEGILSAGVAPMLTTVYDGGVTAASFAIPGEVVDVLEGFDFPIRPDGV